MVHIPVLVTSLIITTETSVLSQTLECGVTECVREERKLAHHDKALNNKSSLKHISTSSLVVERNLRVTILKSTKQGPCIAKGWARLILRCCSHSKHRFLKTSLSVLSCTMTTEILQEQGACLPNGLLRICCVAEEGCPGTSVLFWKRL